MTEYAFTPGTIEARVGQHVTLNLVNKGALEHEIMFGQNVKMTDNHPDGYMLDMFLKAGIEPSINTMEGMVGDMQHEHSGIMVTLNKTGDEANLSFTVTKEMVGEWEMGCFALEGVHYASGMVGKLIVKP
jgi:plastocyanin